ncbi:caspase, EACC1-associated type [Micromonospora sp. WMMC250]|uniref:caspase, EACC1-associated type n=1 Tax=Micromonospora sp. WMMC250 TaxID=3014781 RepID=UPI0022B71837|nr:hypothetical protein [Micromonospora sp. WMMC250]MCZ7374678.1 hypothetical protein [Micromonospora sp. WMMC250]
MSSWDADVGRLDPGQSVAVLIGVTDYPRSDFPSVPQARESVRRLAAELADTSVWGVSRPTRLFELIDPDRAAVLRTVADAGQLVKRQGMLLVYFVGHAEPAGGELCLAMRDADRQHPRATMVPVSELVAAAGGSRADKRMLVLDCCFSGRAAAALPGASVKIGEAAGWYFIGAADGSTEASVPPDGELTLFTDRLVQALDGLSDGPEWFTPAHVWRATAVQLPPDHQPVHNDLAWADRQPWVRNRRWLPRPRRAHAPTARIGDADAIAAPPELYAVPRYLGSHAFVGRAGQLETLDDWASAAQPHPVLLFEAIGGTGKSMLTWQWVTRYAPIVRPDLAGRIWYSFYDSGATMADFCRHAVAYMTGRPLADLRGMKVTKLTELLLEQLRSRPWLLVLDGVERLLVAYHRHDASQLPDDLAGTSEEFADRDPCSAIRPVDDELLQQLTDATPSKVLVTSRLTPQILLNAANQPIPGVLVERLPGLRPADAEAMLRGCGVTGDSHRIQDYLQRHCDCHPLVAGIIAGLVNNYLPARGDFDRWATDPEFGGRLNLGDPDLPWKRNHILTAALDALPEASRRLLSALSILTDAVDYPTMAALHSDHRPPPTGGAWPDDPIPMPKRQSSTALAATVTDLERRGLLQYERNARRWDLHPVVRATARDRLLPGERDRIGQQIIDHFSQQSPNTYEHATSLDDLRDALTVARTTVQIEQFNNAAELIRDLTETLAFRLEAYPELVALTRPILTMDRAAEVVRAPLLASLATSAGIALGELGLEHESAESIKVSLTLRTELGDHFNMCTDLRSIAIALTRMRRFTIAGRCFNLTLELAGAIESREEQLLTSRVMAMAYLGLLGRWAEAERYWRLLEPMNREVDIKLMRPGAPDIHYLAHVAFPQGKLTSEALSQAERIAARGRNRKGVRQLHHLRGQWLLQRGETAEAAEALQEAVRMARESGFPDVGAEALLALAQVRARSGRHDDARAVAHRLSSVSKPPHQTLAELRHTLGDTAQAITHAHAAYAQAWAEGEPYVDRYGLTQAEALLRILGVQPPNLPPYAAANHPVEDWERQAAEAVAAYLAETRS